MFAIVDEKQQSLLGVAISFTVLPALFVGLRTYCRLGQKQKLTATDFCLFGALFLDFSITAACLINLFVGGVGLHQDTLSKQTIITYLQTLFAIELLWAGAEGLLKTSMCLLYIEIFRTKRFRIAAYIVMAVCNAFAAMVVLSTTFICNPVQLSWNPFIDGTCGNRNALWLSIGVLNIITDALVLFLPLPMVWALQISTQKKVAVSGIFGLGFFVCIVSIVRLKFLLQVDFYGDTSYTVTDAILWSTLEPTTGVIVACLPTLGPLFRSFLSLIGVKGSQYNSTHNHRSTILRGNRETQTFERLSEGTHAEFPLTSVAIGKNKDLDTEADSSSDGVARSVTPEAMPGQISVKQEWTVSHSTR